MSGPLRFATHLELSASGREVAEELQQFEWPGHERSVPDDVTIAFVTDDVERHLTPPDGKAVRTVTMLRVLPPFDGRVSMVRISQGVFGPWASAQIGDPRAHFESNFDADVKMWRDALEEVLSGYTRQRFLSRDRFSEDLALMKQIVARREARDREHERYMEEAAERDRMRYERQQRRRRQQEQQRILGADRPRDDRGRERGGRGL